MLPFLENMTAEQFVETQLMRLDRTAGAFAELLPFPEENAHKYSRGGCLIVAGSAAYPGAAALAARAAQRCGAGYVKLVVPETITQLLQMKLSSVPVAGLPCEEGHFAESAAADIPAHAGKMRACVVGPGVTRCEATNALVESLAQCLDVPVLFDADALWAVANKHEAVASRGARGCSTVLTPHDGEMCLLLAGLGFGSEAKALLAESLAMRIALAAYVAREYKAVVVLKGPYSIVTDGTNYYVNDSGTPALATAGTGDVLSGMVGSFLGQGLPTIDAVALGVYLHGVAGHAAARELTELCVIAEDVIEYIPQAVKHCLNKK